MIGDDIRHSKEKLSNLVSKVVHYQHHWKFLEACLNLDITPKGLKINKTSCIRSNNNNFIQDWNNSLKKAEKELIQHLKKENLNIFIDLQQDLLEELKRWSLLESDTTFLGTLTQDLQNLESELFNRRVSKAVRLSETHTVREIRQKMLLEHCVSSEVHNFHLKVCQQKSIITTRIRKSKSNEQEKTEKNNTANISLNDETLVNILADLLQDETEPLEIITETKSIGETSENVNDKNQGQRIQGQFISKNVFNLSHRVLTETEISLLDKGLQFVPTPEKIDRHQIKKDLERLGRHIRLKMHFQYEPSANFSTKPAFRVPSNWTPPINDIQLEIYLSEVEEQLMNINESGKSYPNLSKDELKALKDLANDQSIIIKPADKGNAIVIWDREDYILEADKQLSDKNVYESINSSPLKNVNKEIKDVLLDIYNRNEIDKKTKDYLVVKNPQLGRFYMLPKIHKRTKDVPGRPVISNNGTATENISAFLDFHLKGAVQNISHILEDTRDFLSRIVNKVVPEGSILVTFDVVGLYPHIPHDEGIDTMRKFLNERADQNVSTQNLCKLENIILKHNYFEFGEKIFHQLLGTAIGTKFAPPYANIFMAGLEEKIFREYNTTPYIWLRYLDDIFYVWTEGEEKLKEFLNFLNNIHPTIKFTMDYSSKKVDFLDVTITKSENGKLETNLYSKPTDTHQFLHATSCHRASCKNGIPYSQAIRLKRICSLETELQENLQNLEHWLVYRGYQRDRVKREISRVNDIDRFSLLLKKEKGKDDTVTLTLTFHPALHPVVKILKKAHRHILKSPILSKVLPKPPRVAFRNPKTLKDKLVRSKLRTLTSENEIKGFVGCGRANCEICKIVEKGDEFESSVNGRKFKINFQFNCNSQNVIYLLTCRHCFKQYVGSTITKFRQRFNQYKSNINV